MKLETKTKESCPNCENELKIHSNEQLQRCALQELFKINRRLGVNDFG